MKMVTLAVLVPVISIGCGSETLPGSDNGTSDDGQVDECPTCCIQESFESGSGVFSVDNPSNVTFSSAGCYSGACVTLVNNSYLIYDPATPVPLPVAMSAWVSPQAGWNQQYANYGLTLTCSNGAYVMADNWAETGAYFHFCPTDVSCNRTTLSHSAPIGSWTLATVSIDASGYVTYTEGTQVIYQSPNPLDCGEGVTKFTLGDGGVSPGDLTVKFDSVDMGPASCGPAAVNAIQQ